VPNDAQEKPRVLALAKTGPSKAKAQVFVDRVAARLKAVP
jgi:cyclophilin family peptidyl-prolyl cis-trans isomerase